MSTYTIKDISDLTGVSKGTIKRRAQELGIYDSMRTIGGRGTKVMTAEQAEMLTDAVQRANPHAQRQVDVTMEAIKTDAEILLREQIDILKARCAELQSSINAERTDRQAEREGYQERIRRLESDLHYAQACVSELAAAPWWRKRSIIARYALPPATSD